MKKLLLLILSISLSPLAHAMQKPKDLIQAAKDGDVERVRVLIWKSKGIKSPIDREAYLNQTDDRGNTPLIWAAYNGHLEIVKELLAAGAKVNAISNGGYTPLMNAIEGNHPDIVKELIATKKIDTKSEPKYLLYMAMQKKMGLDLIKALIWLNFDMDYDNGFYTPLKFAVEQNNLEITKVLLTEFSNEDAERLGPIMFSLKESGMQDMIEPMLSIMFIENHLEKANQRIMRMSKLNNENAHAQALKLNHSELAALLDPDNQDSQNELRQLITKNIRAIEEHINEILKAKFKSTQEHATNPSEAK